MFKTIFLLLMAVQGFCGEVNSPSRKPATIPQFEMGWNQSNTFETHWLKNLDPATFGPRAQRQGVRILFWDLKKKEAPAEGQANGSESFRKRSYLQN